MFYVYKKNVKYRQKSKINLLFLRKTSFEASKFITKSFRKLLDFVHLNLKENDVACDF